MIHPALLQLLAAARHDDLTRKADQARHAHAATRRPGTCGRLRAAVTRALQPLAAHRRRVRRPRP
jgi:hypothetical protein